MVLSNFLVLSWRLSNVIRDLGTATALLKGSGNRRKSQTLGICTSIKHAPGICNCMYVICHFCVLIDCVPCCLFVGTMETSNVTTDDRSGDNIYAGTYKIA